VTQDDDPESVLAASEFNRVWEVVRALRDHDEDLAEELDALRREQGRRGSVGERPRKIHLDLPEQIARSFGDAFDARLVETTTRGWESKFGVLQRFVDREGHSVVPKDHVEAGVALGSWVTVQRGEYTRGALGPSRAERLASFPGWVWNTREDAWERGYRVLSQFAEREGHTSLSTDRVEEGFRLGQWVGVQRGRRDAMSEERRRRLEALPGWTWNLRESKWDRAYQALASFAEREGHARPTIRHQESRVRLGQWVNVQRTLFGKGTLRADRIAALESVPGWVWDANDADWEAGFDALAAFVEREGHADVPGSRIEDGYPLGTWVASNRTDGKAGRLAPSRAARLEALPGWVWSRRQDKWDAMYAEARRLSGHRDSDGVDADAVRRWLGKQRAAYRDGRLAVERQEMLEQLPGFSWTEQEDRWARTYDVLAAFVAREGHANVPQRHVEAGVGLGAWVNAQRRQFAQGDLDTTRRKRLESIPGWSWSVLEDSWSAAYGLLARHAARTGSARVRDDHVEGGVRLGAWARKQRTRYAEGSLSQLRIEMLEALPGWVWSKSSDADWEEGFAFLQRYAERVGRTRVPPNHCEEGFRLGGWVQAQRSARNRGRRSPEREARLEALPGWTWDPHADAWEAAFEALNRYADREGTARVRRDHVESGFALGAWCHNQRGKYRRGTIRPERAARLEALPGWAWETRNRS
jgi:hypothetical protein